MNPFQLFANKFLSLSMAVVMMTVAIPMATLSTTGCNSATALADVKKFEPIVINVLNLICTINPSEPICGTGLQTIEGDYTTVVQLWTDYNAAVAAGTSTVAAWNILNAAFTTFENDSALIFSLGLGLNSTEVTAIVVSAQ